MKTVLLAGGFGTRISEESHLKPKPMIEIGEKPILWHIMMSYSTYGYNEFVICCGYKQHIVKEYFSNLYLHNSDVTFDFKSGNTMQIHNSAAEEWRVTIVDTGLRTMTGGRLKRVQKYCNDSPFMLTYGDGVADIDIDELVKFHKFHGKTATITTVKPEPRFGVLDISQNQVNSFSEKSEKDVSVVNGGFMVFEPKIFDYIEGDSTILEKEPFEKLAAAGQLMAYSHDGFWQCMDSQRDKHKLEDLWESGKAPWRTW